jgi:hypothetical protein
MNHHQGLTFSLKLHKVFQSGIVAAQCAAANLDYDGFHVPTLYTDSNH